MSAHLSPQARRRLDEHLHGAEWKDLAAEVADALEAASEGRTGLVYGEEERSIILAALQGRPVDAVSVPLRDLTMLTKMAGALATGGHVNEEGKEAIARLDAIVHRAWEATA
jgi:hypothetical protein